MVAPAQLKIDQERDEARHQKDVIEGCQIDVDVINQGRRLGTDADFLVGGQRRRYWNFLLVVVDACRGVALRLLLLLKTLGHQGAIHALFDVVHAAGGAVDQSVDAFAIGREVVQHRQTFGINPEAGQVEKHQTEAADHEARESPRHFQFHEKQHGGVEQEGNDRRDYDGNEKYPAEI